MYFDDLKFRYEFRDYQQRVLDTLNEKLDDNKLHIVAAPGSGKTILGLEIIRRIDSPAIVLVPSISIREQWIERFLDSFVTDKEKESWKKKLSTDLNTPALLTCVTYQALFSMFYDNRLTDIVKLFRKNKIHVIVLDESHHLKKEWWKAIEMLNEGLDNPTIISLTATPPYDCGDADWARYSELCGEIDCEVLTPEMVKKHTLCPYQDHVYLSVPTDEEIRCMNEGRAKLVDNIREILVSEDLYLLMRDYDALIKPTDRTEIFIEEPLYINALLAYVGGYGIESKAYYEKADRVKWDKSIMRLAGEENVPELNGRLLEIFLNVIIKKEAEHFDSELLEKFKNELKKRNILSNQTVNILDKQEEIEKISKNSVSKMNSVKEICCVEAQSMKDELRMVILADNIGKEELSKIGSEENFSKMNCVSIFEMLRRKEQLNNIDAYMKSYISYIEEMAGSRLGLLCGSFAILPENARDYFATEVKALGNTGYFMTDIDDSNRKNIVSLVTRILSDGVINILTGTVSLLGEGWDAPCVNTVVIASTVSSYVQTNQMRGRGMRLDADKPQKTANIWHLATLVADENGNYKAGDDYNNLVKRFGTIMGISRDGSRIENSIERIGLSDENSSFSLEEQRKFKVNTIKYATDRGLIRQQWNRLISYNTGFEKVRDVVTVKKRSRIFRRKADNGFRLRDIEKIAFGLHKDMTEAKMLSKDTRIQVKVNKQKKIEVYLENASLKESKLFLKYYEQMVSEVVAPRYMICCKAGLKESYVNIPDYCKNKASAQKVMDYVGLHKSKLIYTRNSEGAELLFKLRCKSINIDKKTIGRIREVVL